MALRLAWHASGTYSDQDGTGGSDGATMRFAPESEDPANAGLSIARDMLLEVKAKHPEVSYADLWAYAGAVAVEFLGGPKIKMSFCRRDAPNGSFCPVTGRLPDASQGAAHLRDVFGRMGFNDQEIVALSGAHTLGRCHLQRSGFDGPWTRNPLKFDNQYFKTLLHMEWRPRKWDGPLQFEDVMTGELMMLPTDMAIKTDPALRAHAEKYAKDEKLFFRDFAKAFGKLLSLGTNPVPKKTAASPEEEAGAEFREAAMHGSLEAMKRHAIKADVHAVEQSSGRTALHKAAFWGHELVTECLLKEFHLDPNTEDYAGDTPLHDAARFGHLPVVRILLDNGANARAANKAGRSPLELAEQYGKPDVATLLRTRLNRL